MVATGVGLGYKGCCGGYRGKMRTSRVLWWIQGLAEDSKGGFCGHWLWLR